MSIAAVVPVIQAVSAIASTVVSALTGSTGDTGSPSGMGLNQMDHVLKRQAAMQLKTMEMQTEANIQKMMADTANAVISGHLDSGTKIQNAGIKAAQGIHF